MTNRPESNDVWVLKKLEIVLNDLLPAVGVYEISSLRLEHVGKYHIFAKPFLPDLYLLPVFLVLDIYAAIGLLWLLNIISIRRPG